jgi:hypothetical protein
MPNSAKFQLNHAGVGELLQQESMRADLAERVKRVEQVAKDIAPVETGEYRDSIESGVMEDDERWTGYVVAQVPYALAVEAKHRTLGTALDAAART